jgi:hypothetical protein
VFPTKKDVEENIAKQIYQHFVLGKEEEEEKVQSPPASPLRLSSSSDEIITENYVSKINEYAQKKRLSTPIYTHDTTGPAHNPTICATGNHGNVTNTHF